MAITTTLSRSAFHDLFRDGNRGNQFSYEAKNIIFDYFNEQDSDVSFDLVGFCCEYEEVDLCDMADRLVGMGDLDFDADDDDIKEALANYTEVIGVTDSTIIFATF